MTRARSGWWNTVAQEKDYLLLSLGYAQVSFEVAVLALKDFERRFLREVRTPAERLHLQRLTTKDILVQAYGDARRWPDFGPHLSRMMRLGYPNLRIRVLIACLYVQSLALFPHRAREAFGLLDDAERRVKRMPKANSFRQQLLDGIGGARRVAEEQSLWPPELSVPD
jgi:hypothetical protein